MRRLTGLFPAELVRRTEIPRLPAAIVAGYQGLADWTGNTSDAMDELGLPSGAPDIGLGCNRPDGRAVGQVLTLRNVANDPADPNRASLPGHRLGDVECYHLALPGDVLVVEGIDGISSMGGISASIAQRVMVAGAIVAGSVRDVGHGRALGFPIWSRSTTPASGKYRLRTAEIMGPVTIGGVRVEPGDLAVADETGVCFVPYAEAARVLARAAAISERERSRLGRIDDEIPHHEFPREE
jgi:regulator of RNase E activity RraA